MNVSDWSEESEQPLNVNTSSPDTEALGLEALELEAAVDFFDGVVSMHSN